MPIIAQCIVHTGYGTDIYDDETGESTYETWADIRKILLNEPYWKNYKGSIHHDFLLDLGFSDYELTVYDDGRKEAREL